MKQLILLFCLLTFLVSNLIAQHCPFDGGYLISVHLIDGKGKPLRNKNPTLIEVNNSVANSCSYAEGLLKKPFMPTKSYLQNHFERYWEHWIEPNYKDWILFNPGYYAISLNQAEYNCMIKRDGDFEYRKRQFEIHYSEKGSNQKIQVPADKIYSLCTNNGSWTRIVPIEIKIK